MVKLARKTVKAFFCMVTYKRELLLYFKTQLKAVLGMVEVPLRSFK